MIDKRELEKVCNKIYSIRCRESDCVECQLKYDTIWCPKSYADEIMEGIKAINNNIEKARGIVKIRKGDKV